MVPLAYKWAWDNQHDTVHDSEVLLTRSSPSFDGITIDNYWGVQLSQNVPVVFGILVINMTFNSWWDSTPCNFHQEVAFALSGIWLLYGVMVSWTQQLRPGLFGSTFQSWKRLSCFLVFKWFVCVVLVLLLVVVVVALVCTDIPCPSLFLPPTKWVWFMKATVSTPNPWFVQRTPFWRILSFSGRQALGRPVTWGMFSSRCRRWFLAAEREAQRRQLPCLCIDLDMVSWNVF